MPNKTIQFLLKEVEALKKTLNEHLIQSGGIQAHLKWNTVITTLVLAAIITKFIAEYFKH